MYCRTIRSFLLVFCITMISSEAKSLDATEIYNMVRPSLCLVVSYDGNGEEIGFGSGFVVSEHGEVVTNAHVIEGATEVRLQCGEHKTVAKKVKSYKAKIDLVVLDSELRSIPPLRLYQDKTISPGAVVFAMGNPYGLNATITTGLVSGVRTFDGVDYLQISAQINPGNSGGPVVTNLGEVVGIATMSLKNTSGLGFAIPIITVLDLPVVDISFKEIKTNKDKESMEVAKISGLEFRGIPLGSKCNEIREVEDQIIKSKSLALVSYNPSGKNYTKVDIFGEKVTAIFECRDGRLVKGIYNNYGFIGDRIIKAVNSKYGEPTIKKHVGNIPISMGKLVPNINYYEWRLGDGKVIVLDDDKKFVEYVDYALLNLLEKIEALKSIESNDF